MQGTVLFLRFPLGSWWRARAPPSSSSLYVLAAFRYRLYAVDPPQAADRGLFLPETWRLHPDITDFTSEMFYRGRLRSKDGLDQQVLGAGGPVDGSGLHWIPAEHAGNQNQSDEEVALVTNLVTELLQAEPTWTYRDGTVQTVGLPEILVVAPYNAQVSALTEALPEGARVGTVDKFQGQEAPVVIYSMTHSSLSRVRIRGRRRKPA